MEPDVVQAMHLLEDAAPYSYINFALMLILGPVSLVSVAAVIVEPRFRRPIAFSLGAASGVCILIGAFGFIERDHVMTAVLANVAADEFKVLRHSVNSTLYMILVVALMSAWASLSTMCALFATPLAGPQRKRVTSWIPAAMAFVGAGMCWLVVMQYAAFEAMRSEARAVIDDGHELDETLRMFDDRWSAYLVIGGIGAVILVASLLLVRRARRSY